MPMFWWKVVRKEHSLLEYKHRRFVHGLLRRLTGLDEFRLNNEHNHGSENGNEYSAYKRLGEWDTLHSNDFLEATRGARAHLSTRVEPSYKGYDDGEPRRQEYRAYLPEALPAARGTFHRGNQAWKA